MRASAIVFDKGLCGSIPSRGVSRHFQHSELRASEQHDFLLEPWCTTKRVEPDFSSWPIAWGYTDKCCGFGTITSTTNNPRQFQFAFKMLF
jgi:hypothetical protein